ncbi:hypothetical protein EVB87_058 [Rhizobium phage RHph_N28_1]|nr:hypothetical protein EVB87_058 [Rhizobium phage RHph_N28_1]QIG74086.1 hypothetical protein EVC07_058 [Rhizobium phage RHph_N42]QXV73746.1 hypothetical protein [Rhizobium phage RHph_N46]
MASMIKRLLGKNDMKTRDWIFAGVAIGTTALAFIGSSFVEMQYVELGRARETLESRRVHMCIAFKAHAIVYHFVDAPMLDYCRDVIGDMSFVTSIDKD